MANNYIVPIYRDVYGEDFDYSDFPKRLKMQKMVYLFEQMGFSIGDYNFSWYKHGPYSQQLLDDMYSASKLEFRTLNYTPSAKQAIEKLRSILSVTKGISYSSDKWAECVASLHYLKKNGLPSSYDDVAILEELEKRKPRLDNHETNLKALRVLQFI